MLAFQSSTAAAVSGGETPVVHPVTNESPAAVNRTAGYGIQSGAPSRAAVAAAKARDTKPGGKPESLSKRELGSGRGVAVRMEKAKAWAVELAPIIADLRAGGAVTLGVTLGHLAAGLNAAGVPTARGGEWSAVQVPRVLARMETP